MLSEEFVSSLCGGPLSSNTSIAKDVGIYVHTLSPAYSVKSAFKKNSAAPNCVAVNGSHIFAAQHEKAALHVYSRIRGNQEAYVPFPERIRCVALAGDVLILGTAEGRIMLWEFCTGRLVSTPACHVQPVTCLAVTPHSVLSGSDDSNVHVWSLAQLLELDIVAEQAPERTLSNHRAAITALAASSGADGGSGATDSTLCVSASKDKTCVVWNYRTGLPLRTLLFPASPLCLSLDPCTRALTLAADDGSVYLVELFGEPALLGPHAAEAASTVVQVTSPFGMAPPEAGPASCLATSYDGTVLLSGHAKGKILQWSLADNSPPTELADLNAAVSNLVFVPPLPSSNFGQSTTKSPTIVKPAANADKTYAFTAHFNVDLGDSTEPSRFDKLMNTPGFSEDVLKQAILAFQQPSATATPAVAANGSSDDRNEVEELRRQNEELLQIVNEQKALYKQVLQRQAGAQS
ncbi:WD repeat-containing protein [Pyricularia oryzae 70-15]|uniref:Pre-rRNA-processing protein IPI3 n=3 Tax=Pyricularia oryzae TaxID=318829 RepID=G5EGX7_PYRO7|nr:WD repeat-containing protein [Pyricularia oryzae 70-15]ELQ41037.1 WD repeat-containing protein [Pyricularia oryzae Y34]KAI7916620.1 WD repeat-containing protein [Pyricularia oryzae]EAQ71445.1 hypothetical protein MGCH7_ch7g852 [Pyricularia oryzae 70-15]EHA45881.1 WD repeat-containing protein [Pyricularia oryzae 70-15]KAI7922792.1 WD repeat-containing protein [Pyricularia oryzae]